MYVLDMNTLFGQNGVVPPDFLARLWLYGWKVLSCIRQTKNNFMH